jgi:hypothetical protein
MGESSRRYSWAAAVRSFDPYCCQEASGKVRFWPGAAGPRPGLNATYLSVGSFRRGCDQVPTRPVSRPSASQLPGRLAVTRPPGSYQAAWQLPGPVLPPAGDDELTNSKTHHDGLRHSVTSVSPPALLDARKIRLSNPLWARRATLPGILLQKSSGKQAVCTSSVADTDRFMQCVV